MFNRLLCIIMLILGLSLFTGVGCSEKSSERPEADKYLYDYADILTDVEEYTVRYLNSIRNKYFMEAMIVTLPSINNTEKIENVAVDLFSKWKIGKDYGGRGILLLLVKDKKLVKLEVSYELEDVFTDMFCGYIEDVQLGPYFLNNQIDIGLIAVMEELENRAQIKHQAKYTKDSILKIDDKLLSGGAGGKRNLSDFKKINIADVGAQYVAGNTPAESWQTMIRAWHDKIRDPNLGFYTEITKLAYRDFTNLPDSRFEKETLTYTNKPYEVIQNQNYAVIFFGKKKGWENAPFLFCKTSNGWKFDIVHQRKYIRMGSSPKWGIERGDYPYIDLLSRCPYWMRQDIPLEGNDIYKIEDDVNLANEIKELEQKYKNLSNDFNTAMKLGRLYAITALGRKAVPVLNRAKKLEPENSTLYKYLAIAHTGTTYQYETAIKEMKVYTEKQPQDVFGHNFLGYLYFCVDKYDEAINELEKAVRLKPDNCYAYCKLSRCYGMSYLKSSKLNPLRNKYKDQAIQMLDKAKNTFTSNPRRIKWLKYWLRKKNIL